MSNTHGANLRPGDSVVITELPKGLIDGLPEDEQKAVKEVIGKAILLLGYDSDGRCELEFADSNGVLHYIYVSPTIIRRSE